MKAFAKAVNEADSININDAAEIKFAKWLSVITQKEINNKAIIEDAYKDEEEISMAVHELVKYGEDKYTRQKYARRKDDIQHYNVTLIRAEQDRQRAERAEAENVILRKKIAEFEAQAKN